MPQLPPTLAIVTNPNVDALPGGMDDDYHDDLQDDDLQALTTDCTRNNTVRP